MNENKYPFYLGGCLLILIVLLPIILKLPACSSGFDYSHSGEIGDTIGGIASPFINAIAAILVFVAFREQVKANNILKQQQYFQHIDNQINRLEEHFIETLISSKKAIDKDFQSRVKYESDKTTGKSKLVSYEVDPNFIREVNYIVILFTQIIQLALKIEDENDMMKTKIFYLYSVKYGTHIHHIKEMFESRKSIPNTLSSTDEQLLLLQISFLEAIVFKLVPVPPSPETSSIHK